MAEVTTDKFGVRRFRIVSDKFGTRPVDARTPVAEKSVHDDGHVALIATYGSDDLIVDAAQISYGKTLSKAQTTVRGTDHTRRLIRYLLRHQHTSPFEQAEATFFLRLPIFVARQLVRHRTANLNEYSARYTELSDSFYLPLPSAVARQSTTNKQGRGEVFTDTERVRQIMFDAQQQAMDAYRALLDEGLARELARVVTPVGSYTEMYWKCDLHNLMHMFKLRLDPHAQQEIRDYAEAMFECVLPYFPLTIEAFEDYSRNAYTLSALEIDMLRDVLLGYIRGEWNAPFSSITGWPENRYGMSEREYSEFTTFLDSLLSR